MFSLRLCDEDLVLIGVFVELLLLSLPVALLIGLARWSGTTADDFDGLTIAGLLIAGRLLIGCSIGLASTAAVLRFRSSLASTDSPTNHWY